MDKLERIYQFLESNREFNYKLKHLEFNTLFSYNLSTREKVIGLLYQISATQLRPRLSAIGAFYSHLYEKESLTHLDSFTQFIEFLQIRQNKILEVSYKGLFEGLSYQPLWGMKTSALFSKVVFQCHCGCFQKFKFWHDAPEELDIPYLPVDNVIIEVFKALGHVTEHDKRHPFWTVNDLIGNNSTWKKEVWDDLWFWGFITQKTAKAGKPRLHEWNPDKYWALRYAQKDKSTLCVVESKARRFLECLS